MGGQPFMYDAAPKQTAQYPYSDFDPKAISRSSLTPKTPRPKQDGPLISFNQHPDSYLILPYGNTNAKPMNPKIKTQVKNTRILQLVLRCLELLGAIGLLVTMILITNVAASTGWLMRIPAGVAVLNTTYGIYHLARRPGGRTPASSASYMLFASAFDASIIPFYAFGALMAAGQYNSAKTGLGKADQWSSLLPAGQAMLSKLSGTAFLCATIAGGCHVISLALGLWLAVTFRKITSLPPDMNPLEDNLTSRHKRNKSSMSASTISEKRISDPLESRRRSGAPYEALARPPTIPFFHTRQGSTESFGTYQTTPPGSRDSRLDLPSRQYQIQSRSNSPRASVVELKRSSYHAPAPTSPTKPNRASYTEIPLNDRDTSSQRSSRPGQGQLGNITEAWYTADSLPAAKRTSPRKSQPKAIYHPLFNTPDSEETDVTSNHSASNLSAVSALSNTISHPNPLEANPIPPRHTATDSALTTNMINPFTNRPARKSALSEISVNQSSGSGDLADMSRERDQAQDQTQVQTQNQNRDAKAGHGHRSQKDQKDQFKAKFYGELRAATPPVAVGTANGRQLSSGNDFVPSFKVMKRDVSGKVAEEGRGGASDDGWRARFRKVSGK